MISDEMSDVMSADQIAGIIMININSNNQLFTLIIFLNNILISEQEDYEKMLDNESITIVQNNSVQMLKHQE